MHRHTHTQNLIELNLYYVKLCCALYYLFVYIFINAILFIIFFVLTYVHKELYIAKLNLW